HRPPPGGIACGYARHRRVEVADPAEEQQFQTPTCLEMHWLHRAGADAGNHLLLQRALTELVLPSGEGYAWVAAEASAAKALRRYLVDQRGFPKDRVKAAAYWKQGVVAVHETYDDGTGDDASESSAVSALVRGAYLSHVSACIAPQQRRWSHVAGNRREHEPVGIQSAYFLWLVRRRWDVCRHLR